MKQWFGWRIDVKHEFKDHTDPDSAHHEVCEVVAERFELFDDEKRFPLWLSFVVQGIGREIGVLK